MCVSHADRDVPRGQFGDSASPQLVAEPLRDSCAPRSNASEVTNAVRRGVCKEHDEACVIRRMWGLKTLPCAVGAVDGGERKLPRRPVGSPRRDLGRRRGLPSSRRSVLRGGAPMRDW